MAKQQSKLDFSCLPRIQYKFQNSLKVIQKSPSLSQKSQLPQAASQLLSKTIEIKRKPISKDLYKQVSRRQVELKKRP